MLNLDTHILIHAFEGHLTVLERKLLSEDSWSISPIVLWEMAKLAQQKKIELDIHSAEFGRAIAQIRIWPLDWAVCLQAMKMDFQSDPADEIIAATSIVHRIPLLTRDRKIRRSKLVPLA
jgi:PIN domain nuclease of toxin-antitoxin system